MLMPRQGSGPGSLIGIPATAGPCRVFPLLGQVNVAEPSRRSHCPPGCLHPRGPGTRGPLWRPLPRAWRRRRESVPRRSPTSTTPRSRTSTCELRLLCSAGRDRAAEVPLLCPPIRRTRIATRCSIPRKDPTQRIRWGGGSPHEDVKRDAPLGVSRCFHDRPHDVAGRSRPSGALDELSDAVGRLLHALRRDDLKRKKGGGGGGWTWAHQGPVGAEDRREVAGGCGMGAGRRRGRHCLLLLSKASCRISTKKRSRRNVTARQLRNVGGGTASSGFSSCETPLEMKAAGLKAARTTLSGKSGHRSVTSERQSISFRSCSRGVGHTVMVDEIFKRRVKSPARERSH